MIEFNQNGITIEGEHDDLDLAGIVRLTLTNVQAGTIRISDVLELRLRNVSARSISASACHIMASNIEGHIVQLDADDLYLNSFHPNWRFTARRLAIKSPDAVSLGRDYEGHSVILYFDGTAAAGNHNDASYWYLVHGSTTVPLLDFLASEQVDDINNQYIRAVVVRAMARHAIYARDLAR